jgi:hypothetical protein
LLDKKGRLFGIINIIDFLVIAVLLAAVGGVYYFKFAPARRATSGATDRSLEIQVLVPGVRMATVNVIKIGDNVRDSRTNIILGQITAIDVRPAEVITQMPDGKVVEGTSPSRKDMYVTLKGQGTVSENAISLGGSEIRIGSQLALKTNMYAVTTTVMLINYK